MRQLTVAIIYKYIPQYRKDFFDKLKERLAEQGIKLRLIYGQPGCADAQKGDDVDIDWGIKVHTKIFRILGTEVYWQPILSQLQDVDLVIVEQASKLLVNYLLLLFSIVGIRKMAFWGHGKNVPVTKANQISEWLKKRLSNKAHWFFAYTHKGADIVHGLGYPYDRITIVQNAIDTCGQRALFGSISADEKVIFRDLLGLHSNHVGLFVGGMYPDRNIEFLLAACEHIRSRLPDFEMLFAGSGVDVGLVQESAMRNAWIHYLGPRFGKDKALCFSVADAFLMPGVVGLVILDCFAMQLPLVTTRRPNHGPEIDYLIDGVNGLIVSDSLDPREYAKVVSNLLLDTKARHQLVDGCKQSAEIYTVEQMVSNFAAGVGRALKSCT